MAMIQMAERSAADHSAAAARFTTPWGDLRLESWGKGILRFCLGGSGAYKSPTGIEPGFDPPPLDWNKDGLSCHLSAGEIGLTINTEDGSLSWHDGRGNEFLSQPFPELAAQRVTRYKSGGGETRSIKTVDGERSISENLVPFHDRDAFRAKVYFNFAAGEALHGLGQAEEGIYDYNGKTQYLYQHNMRIPIPFLLSGRGYGILFDCGCLMSFNGGENSGGGDAPWFFLDTVDALDFYVIRREGFDAIIAGMRELTGAASLLPKWAFGYIQSKEAYLTQDELVEVAREYRKRHIPLDCVVQDWNTWEPGKWGNKRADKSRYPDLAAALEELHGMNVHAMVSVWPNMNPKGEDHGEFAAAGKLLLNNSTYDAFDGEARRLYWKQLERELFPGGFDGWWCDSTEPFTSPDWNGAILREPWERFALVGDEHKKYLDPAGANLYALEHARGIYENQRAAAEDRRVINLTRSGWAGSQRYSAVLWSGDITAAWRTIKKQIAEGLNFCMSGLPWWTLDIGGFFTVYRKWQNRGCGMKGNSNPLWFWRGEFEDGVADPGYRELYVRWLQLGCFLPLFRSHGTDTPREIWRFGEAGDPFYDAIAAFIRLRYRLLPYTYSLAGAVAREHYTMLRGLIFDFAGDKTAVALSSQFMFGPAFLVCPVTEPMYYAPGGTPLALRREWSCYLPAGADWYDFWTGQRHSGGTWITAAAPLEIMPLFVRAGSIVPSERAPLEYACEPSDKPLEIRIYSGADGHFVLYEDSGDGYAYERGCCNRIDLSWNETRRVFGIGKAEHDFPQSLCRRGFVLKIGDAEKMVSYSGEAMEVPLP
jgi:alpha-D-xyloside xylohydrolase